MQGNSLSYRNSRIEELKEISGNRDLTQGGTTGGVTAASAIAALQEAGSKLSRDMLKSAYRAFAKQCYLIIELMRQFYDEQRVFRITGQRGESEFVPFSAQGLRAKPVQLQGQMARLTAALAQQPGGTQTAQDTASLTAQLPVAAVARAMNWNGKEVK